MKMDKGLSKEAVERIGEKVSGKKKLGFDEVDYERSQEEAATGDYLGQIEDALKERNEGRDRYYLVSFGWKDADLEPEGSTGVEKVLSALYSEGKDKIGFRAGGHKTFVDPADPEQGWPEETEEDRQYLESMRSVAHEMVSSAPGEGMWTGDDWSFSFSEYLEVEDTGDPASVADAIIAAAKERAKSFETGWAEVDAELNKMYEEIKEHFGDRAAGM